jgi:hypothetical protein
MNEEITLEEMISVVEAYIYERKGKRIKIVFNNLMLFNRHFQLLSKAYDVALAYNNKPKT